MLKNRLTVRITAGADTYTLTIRPKGWKPSGGAYMLHWVLIRSGHGQLSEGMRATHQYHCWPAFAFVLLAEQIDAIPAAHRTEILTQCVRRTYKSLID